ncbi:acyltransferase [Dyella sp.]|uniref:acyltransferase family protein n=1 Tax=Dyella sp. TaxID=1869338 RepID=UPI002ED3E94E
MKLRFAHHLRAIAALLVVFYHYWGIFFSATVRSIVGVPTSFAPAQPEYTHHVMAPPLGDFFYGVFGVGLFFLISGLVIPISLRNLTVSQFLVRRFFRIYPVYWLCLFVSACLYVVSSRYWSTPLSERISAPFLWRNLPLLHSASGMPSLDFVCWSLGVEIKFYIVFALISLFGRHAHRVMTCMVIFSTLCCLVAWIASRQPAQDSMVIQLASDMRFMTFMFLGCLFYYVLYGELSVKAALGFGLIIYAQFLGINMSYGDGFPGVLASNYTYALLVFTACYLGRARFKRNRLLDFLADISFPLYLIHSVIGYVVMPILMDNGLVYTPAWMVSLGMAILAAYGIHRVVEIPANALGKRLGSRRTETRVVACRDPAG